MSISLVSHRIQVVFYYCDVGGTFLCKSNHNWQSLCSLPTYIEYNHSKLNVKVKSVLCWSQNYSNLIKAVFLNHFPITTSSPFIDDDWWIISIFLNIKRIESIGNFKNYTTRGNCTFEKAFRLNIEIELLVLRSLNDVLSDCSNDCFDCLQAGCLIGQLDWSNLIRVHVNCLWCTIQRRR